MKCSNCGTEVNGSNFCPNCGNRVVNNQSEQKKYKNVIKNEGKKKDSPLSIVTVLISFLGFLSVNFANAGIFALLLPAGFIIAIIDLAINSKIYRHLGSWVALVFCFIWFFVVFVF